MGRSAAALLVLAACGNGAPSGGPAFTGLVRVSTESPFPESCADVPGGGTLYRNAEVEPQLAINPKDPRNLVAVWQQDRWSNGGAKGIVTAASFDAGQTWSQIRVPFTRCAGGDFDRGSDPWVTFSPDGTVHQIAYTFNQMVVNRAMQVSRSTDGGKTWSKPILLQHDLDPDLAMDKESITADPLDASRVYAVWDRLTGFTNPSNPLNRGPAWFSRSLDGGQAWEAARIIWDPGADAQTISNQIAVLPSGVLANLYVEITQNSTQHPGSTVNVLLSSDHGTTWSQPVRVDDDLFFGVSNPHDGKGIRSGTVVPSIAADLQTGALYVVWEDARFSGANHIDGIVLSKSVDGGQTWLAQPIQVNQTVPTAPAFTPVVRATNGTVAVTYYDLRDGGYATGWLALSTDGGQTFHDTAMTPRFDLATAPMAGGYFLGDYTGLAQAAGSFVALFGAAHDGDTGNRTDIFFRPANAPKVASEPVAQAALSLFRGARERWRFDTLFK